MKSSYSLVGLGFMLFSVLLSVMRNIEMNECSLPEFELSIV